MTKNYLILYSAVVVVMMLTPMAIPHLTANAVSSSANPAATSILPNPIKLSGYTGITVTANRIPADYWDPCFATECSAGTGPGASMYFELDDSSGNFVQSGFADENGYTFRGLDPLETYYVYPTNCYACHDSTHDVLFEYWGDDGSTDVPREANVGAHLDAWFSCTNGCSGD